MFDEARLIISVFALQKGVPTHILCNKGRTKNVALMKRELREKLRKETSLSWAEINAMTGRAANNRRP